MNPVEDRVRDALAAHAETFAASPDAWEYIQARTTRRTAGAGWLARHRTFLIPAAAAATVLAVALGATAIAHELTDAARPARHGAPAASPTGGVPTGPKTQMFATDPAISAVFALKVSGGITIWNWIGRPSPHYWFPYIATRPQACHWVVQPIGGGPGSCWPLPVVNAGHPAVVISNEALSASNPVISGLAEPAVTSVTAVLRDGQRFRAAIGTAQGFGRLKAWNVVCPAETGAKVIFADADGQVLAELSTTAPPGPGVFDVRQPSHGGVHVFSYDRAVKGGSVTAYLIDGHVAFFSQLDFAGRGIFSPNAAADQLVVDGVAQPYGLACTPDCRSLEAKAFGYAHANVAKVVVRLPGGGQAVADTFPAGWPGSDLRLWQVTLPDNVWPQDGSEPKLIATAHDAAGHVLGQVELGQPWG